MVDLLMVWSRQVNVLSIVFIIPFASLKAQTRHEKACCVPPSILFIIALGIAIHYRARKEEWRNYFDPV